MLLTCASAVQQMTEAAVAKERATLYAELKQSIGHQTLAANADELASLRNKCVHAYLIACTIYCRSSQGLASLKDISRALILSSQFQARAQQLNVTMRCQKRGNNIPASLQD